MWEKKYNLWKLTMICTYSKKYTLSAKVTFSVAGTKRDITAHQAALNSHVNSLMIDQAGGEGAGTQPLSHGDSWGQPCLMGSLRAQMYK